MKSRNVHSPSSGLQSGNNGTTAAPCSRRRLPNSPDAAKGKAPHGRMVTHISRTHVFRYGMSLIFVGVGLFLSLLSRTFLPDGFLIFFLSAVMLAGWFGRTGPGLMAVIISTIT